jgi:CMP-N-acetylneuraminic acid synthetase
MDGPARVVALLPIKAHSEQVKKKNCRDFCGRPLYHHILKVLDRTEPIDHIIIDTDSIRVMQEAPGLSKKVSIVERPPHLRGDHTSMNDVLAHDLTRVDADIYIQTHATNPLLTSATIVSALLTFGSADDCDSLFSVNTPLNRFYTNTGMPINHDPDRLVRTQGLTPIHEENACLYVFTRESFNKSGRRIGSNPRMFPIPEGEAFDINDEYTFQLAQLMAQQTDSRQLTGVAAKRNTRHATQLVKISEAKTAS